MIQFTYWSYTPVNGGYGVRVGKYFGARYFVQKRWKNNLQNTRLLKIPVEAKSIGKAVKNDKLKNMRSIGFLVCANERSYLN